MKPGVTILFLQSMTSIPASALMLDEMRSILCPLMRTSALTGFARSLSSWIMTTPFWSRICLLAAMLGDGSVSGSYQCRADHQNSMELATFGTKSSLSSSRFSAIPTGLLDSVQNLVSRIFVHVTAKSKSAPPSVPRRPSHPPVSSGIDRCKRTTSIKSICQTRRTIPTQSQSPHLFPVRNESSTGKGRGLYEPLDAIQECILSV